MQTKTFLPDARNLRCDVVQWKGSHVTVVASSIASLAKCPQCGQSSGRVHSRYERQLQDLPWHGVAVKVRWHSRRFFCDNGRCEQRIFTERLPELAASHGRKTQRLSLTLRTLALACGGEPGARLAQRLAISTSPDTLLRELRRSGCDSPVRVRVLGVDDWALRRGQRYGTILVDLESHQTIDLLPERSADSFAAWLKQHPEVEIISRDRGDPYIQGANAGAPQAVQVADRWHLLHNLHEALTRVIDRFPKELGGAARQACPVPPVPAELSPRLLADNQSPKSPLDSEFSRSQRRPRWQEKYERFVQLQSQQHSARAIARELELDRGTVRRWMKIGHLPELPGRKRHHRIDSWQAYLEERWRAGCQNAVTLTKELKARGYSGSYYTVRRYLARWRTLKTTDTAHSAASAVTKPPTPSARSVAWWLLKPPPDRDSDQQRFVEAFGELCPPAAQAAALANDFSLLVRNRQAEILDSWLERAASPEIPIEMRRFAQGLRGDLAAVRNALSLPWSNGQTEGQVNRLKLIKRQMFGRAKFDLLRVRVLARES